MKFTQTRAALLACTLLLSACGGGGSGGGGSTGDGGGFSGDQDWLAFTPNPVTVDAIQGKSTSFTINARANKTIPQTFNIGIIEAGGLITTSVSLLPVSAYQYNVTLQTSPLLATGSYSGQLEVRLCEDDPVVCKKPVSGSPWRLPLKLTVKPDDTPPLSMKFAQPSFSLTAVQGEPITFMLSGIAARYINNNVGVIEKNGLLTTSYSPLIAKDGLNYLASLKTKDTLAVGKYSSTLEVRVCEDSPEFCQRPVAGSPWTLPITLDVVSGNNLKALSTLPGVPGWSTLQGNAAHTGAVDASFNSAAFSRRFQFSAADTYYNGVATEGHTAYLVSRNIHDWHIQAINEDNGTQRWDVNLGPLFHLNPPAAINGKVYLTSTGHADSYLWILDQSNGALLAKQAMNSQWPSYEAPTVVGGAVYSEYGYYDGIAKYDATNASEQWTMPIVQGGSWTPTVDAQYTYGYISGNFYAVNNSDGSTAYKLNDPDSQRSSSGPVVLSRGMLYANDGLRVIALNLASRNIAWTSTGKGIRGQPAATADAIYVLTDNGATLEAHAPVTGTTLWTTSLSDLYTTVVVSANLAFVSNGSTTQAIDLKTHKVVWTYQLGGTLAISSQGVLYIISNWKIAAINLQ